MNKVGFKKAESGASRGHPFLTGFMVGLVLGVALCAGVAIYIARSPSPFQNRALENMGVGKDALSPLKPAAPKPVDDNKVAVEPNVTAAPADDTKPSTDKASPPPAVMGNLYIQVGAFASAEDADKQVETVAQVTGVHAKVVTSTGEGNKTLFKVRLGPFVQVGDTGELTQILKSNAIPYALVRPGPGEVVR